MSIAVSSVFFWCEHCGPVIQKIPATTDRRILVNAGLGLGDTTREAKTLHQIARHLDLIGEAS